MPRNLDQFIKLTDATDAYRVSIKTLRVRRDKARQAGDQATFTSFIVKTRDGEIYEQPTTDVINNLTKQGRLPEWLVDHNWLRLEFGPRSNATTDGDAKTQSNDQPTDTPTDHAKTDDQPNNQPDDHPDDPPKDHQSPQDKLISVYEERIIDLKEQLVAYREREKDILNRLLPERTEQRPPDISASTQPKREQGSEPAASEKNPAKTPATKQRGWFSKLISGKN